MSFRNISAWAIRNPVAPIVMFIALLLAGVMAFMSMDVNEQPDIEFPAAQVTIAQPGAAPTELETQVTQKVEAAVRNVVGVDEINSSVREGTSSTFIQFAIGTPVDRAVNDVRDAVANIRSDLPEGILEPQVARINAVGTPIGFFSAESRDMSLEELSWFVDNTVSKRLLSVSGMAAVTRTGGVSREIRITLDPAKLQSQGVTASQVNTQLRSVNLNAAGGRAEIAGSEQSVRVLGNAADAYQLSQTSISAGNGRTIKLADLGTVRDAYAEQRSIGMMDGRQVLAFSLEKSKGASDVTVYKGAQEQMKLLEKENPKVRFTLLSTSVPYTISQYHSAIEAMIEGAVLAVLVVLLFLRDWRATVISAIAIPLSAIPAFWFMDLMGFTLNGISLLALSLVAGVLVDDAIVEIENIVRHMRMGKTAYQASIDAADEIGLAVLATTMAIVAVFLPVGLMPGISGQYFKSFGLTIVISVLLSLAVARLITPMIAAYFLKSHGHAEHGGGWLMDRYMTLLHWTLAHRWKTVAMGAFSLVLTVIMFTGLPFGLLKPLPLTFQPTINTDYSQVRIELTPGSTLGQTKAITDRVREMLGSAPEVEHAFSRISVGSANINLTLRKKRKMTSVEFERSWAPKLNAIPDARVSFQSQQNGGPGNTGRDITITLGGDNPVLLNATANKIVEEMRNLPELRAPRFNGDLLRPEIVIKPRLDLAASMGVTTQALSQAIRIATLGDIDQNSAKFSLSDRQIPIRVALSEASRRSLSTIENLPVPTTTGGSVPLKVVADIGFGAGPVQIQRTNQIRRTSIGVDLAPGLVTGDAMPKINQLPALKNLPAGIKKLDLGAAKWQYELFLSFIIAVISGVLLVFAVLVLLYKRVMPPFVNMGSLLLAPLGGLIALRVTGNPVSMPVLIGMLMLLGIVAKNSILLVDFALEEMNKGVDKVTAIVDAGHKRAQPIVMTTVAMVAGMVPVSLSLTGDGAWRAPMGITVMGGLTLSTLLTLLIVPATFSLSVGIEQKLGPWLSRTLTNGGEGAPEPAPLPAE
jgi:multidrug efflux pump subunit AcrB